MPLSIVISDNDPDKRRLLEEFVRQLGYAVVPAGGGSEQAAPSSIEALDEKGELRPFAQVEADVIRFALAHHGGRMTLVARKLGIGRSTLYRKLKELNLAETSEIPAQ